jgi:copper chaperone
MRIHIEDMHCDGCVRSVTKAIQTLDATATVTADLAQRNVDITTTAPRPDIDAALSRAGFTPG